MVFIFIFFFHVTSGDSRGKKRLKVFFVVFVNAKSCGSDDEGEAGGRVENVVTFCTVRARDEEKSCAAFV